MLSRCLQVKLFVPVGGGLFQRRFVPDTTGRSRFPPTIRLQATILGASVGEMEVATRDGAGLIRNIGVRRVWPGAAVAARLVREAGRVARIASWRRLVWQLGPGDFKARSLARSLGFRETAVSERNRTFEREL